MPGDGFMPLVVVRCPICRGASRADADALGLLVQCPRCDGTFVAEAEAEAEPPAPEPAAAREPRAPTPPPAEQPETSEDDFDFDDSDDEYDSDSDSGPELEPPAEPRPASEPDFDPHREPQGSLPASVLIGLALLPFVVPILWLIVPALTGRPPTLSIAAPLALAVAASVLGLAVIYTVDWTPATRVKGVLLLVGLSYFAGVGLYVLNKETVDRVRRFFGAGLQPGVAFLPPDQSYFVRLPAPPFRIPDLAIPQAEFACYAAKQDLFGQEFVYVVGAGDAKPGRNGAAPGTRQWFDEACADLADRAGGTLDGRPRAIAYQGEFPGRELAIALNGKAATRVVRVFFVKDRAYYLSVEGPGLTADHEFAQRLFESFVVADAP